MIGDDFEFTQRFDHDALNRLTSDPGELHHKLARLKRRANQ